MTIFFVSLIAVSNSTDAEEMLSSNHTPNKTDSSGALKSVTVPNTKEGRYIPQSPPSLTLINHHKLSKNAVAVKPHQSDDKLNLRSGRVPARKQLTAFEPQKASRFKHITSSLDTENHVHVNYLVTYGYTAHGLF